MIMKNFSNMDKKLIENWLEEENNKSKILIFIEFIGLILEFIFCFFQLIFYIILLMIIIGIFYTIF